MRPFSVPVVDCSSKSQYSSMPAISTTRRSCISPQRPRTVGVRSARTRLVVSARSWVWLRPIASSSDDDLGAGLDAVLLDLAQLLIDLLQHVADRRDQLVERLVLAGDLGGGVLLQPRQPLVRQLEELLVARLQRRAGQRLEAVAQLRLGLLEQRHLLRDDLLLVARARRWSGPAPRAASPPSARLRSRSSRDRISSALHLAEPPGGLVEERLRGADRGLVGGDRLGSARGGTAPAPGPRRPGRRWRSRPGARAGRLYPSRRIGRRGRRRASTRRPRQNRVNRRSVTALAGTGARRHFPAAGRLRDCNAHPRTGNASRDTCSGAGGARLASSRAIPRPARDAEAAEPSGVKFEAAAGFPWSNRPPVFVDGFGRRVVRVSRDDAPVELLHLDLALAEHPGFADALRERVAKLAQPAPHLVRPGASGSRPTRTAA